MQMKKKVRETDKKEIEVGRAEGQDENGQCHSGCIRWNP